MKEREEREAFEICNLASRFLSRGRSDCEREKREEGREGGGLTPLPI